MEKLIIKPKNREELIAVKAFLKALNISFKNEEESPYKAKFVAKIKKSQEQFKEGKYITLDLNKSIWENIQ